MTTINGDSTNNLLSGTSGTDTISGGAGDDRIAAGSGNDSIDGGAGNDRIDGGRGEDVILGGAGNDRIDAGSGNDVIDGGAGNDRIDGGSGNDVIDGGAGNDRIDAGSGNDFIDGGAGNDGIDAGSGNDFIDGGAGNDRIDGGKGDDSIYGDSGNDVIDGENGNDQLFGGTGNDILEGGSGNDTLNGGDGQDELLGGSGDDTLIGLEGADWMRSGAGNDVFGYRSASDSSSSGWDRIIDFDQGEDKIDLSALHETNLAWGGNAEVQYGVWYQDFCSSVIIFADTTGDGKADVKIELKNTSGLELTVNDFIGVFESNYSPVLTADTTGGATEDAAYPTLTDSGTLSFTDVDVNDTHTVGTANNNDAVWTGGSLTADQTTAITGGFSADSDSWDYTVANAALQFLGAGETITLSFDVTVTDDSGAENDFDTEIVTLSLIGTNDAPTLTIADTSGNLTEGDGTPTLTDSGALSFADPDTNDLVTVAQTYNNDITWSGGDINPGLAHTLVAGFSIDQDSWDYSTSENLDFLVNGQTIKFSFDLVTTDDSGAGNDTSVAKTVSITLTGTNDDPVANPDEANVVGIGASGNVIANALGRDFDPDAGETGTLIVTTVNGSPDGIGDPVEGSFGLITMLATGDWGYTLTAAATDVDDVFNYTIADLHGATDIGTLTIHITGAGSAQGFTHSVDPVTTGASTGNESPPSDSQQNIPTPVVPVAAGDIVITNGGAFTSIIIPEWALLANDINPDGSPIDVQSVGGPIDGAVAHNAGLGSNGFVTFVDLDVEIDSSFTYVATNEPAASTPATVSVTQNLDGDLTGTTGNDLLVGSNDDPSAINGLQGDDILVGGIYGDVLNGNIGNDTLAGGGGNDFLSGGSGSDLFDFNALADAGTAGDTITDFENGVDHIDLHDLLATLGIPGGTGNALTEDYLRLTQSGGNTLVEIDSNGGVDSFQTLATLIGVTPASADAGDFIF